MSNHTYSIWEFNILLPNGKFESKTLYYYNGNFYYSLFGVPTNIMGQIRRQIRIFMKINAELVKQDRAHPDYKTKLELATEQGL